MIKEALEYLVGLKPNETYGIKGRVYSDRPLHLVSEGKDYRKGVEFHSLDGIVQMIRSEIGDYTASGKPVQIKLNKTDKINENMAWLLYAFNSNAFDQVTIKGTLDMTGDEFIFNPSTK